MKNIYCIDNNVAKHTELTNAAKRICLACNNNLENEVFTAKEIFFGTFKPFHYVHCSACFSLSIQDIPSDLEMAEYYKNYSKLPVSHTRSNIISKIMRKYAIANSNFLAKIMYDLSKSNHNWRDFQFRALLPFNFNEDTKILDVGCGAGYFIKELKSLGYNNGIGIDVFLNQEHMNKNDGKLLRASIFDINDKFDLITFHHSFEHMLNHLSIMNKIHDLLTKDGICIIRIPNVDSYAFRKFRENWYGIHPPFHLILPSVKAIEDITKQANLKIIKIVGENLIESLFYNYTHRLSLSNFDDRLGSLNMNASGPVPKLNNQQLFSSSEIKFWQNKLKNLNTVPTLCHDICYYIQRS